MLCTTRTRVRKVRTAEFTETIHTPSQPPTGIRCGLPLFPASGRLHSSCAPSMSPSIESVIQPAAAPVCPPIPAPTPSPTTAPSPAADSGSTRNSPSTCRSLHRSSLMFDLLLLHSLRSHYQPLTYHNQFRRLRLLRLPRRLAASSTAPTSTNPYPPGLRHDPHRPPAGSGSRRRPSPDPGPRYDPHRPAAGSGSRRRPSPDPPIRRRIADDAPYRAPRIQPGSGGFAPPPPPPRAQVDILEDMMTAQGVATNSSPPGSSSPPPPPSPPITPVTPAVPSTSSRLCPPPLPAPVEPVLMLPGQLRQPAD